MGDATVKQIEEFITAALNLTIATQYLTVAAQLPHQAYHCTRGSKDQDQKLQVYKQLTLKLNLWLFIYHRTESNNRCTKLNYHHTSPHISKFMDPRR